jgi:hypothetical protein
MGFVSFKPVLTSTVKGLSTNGLKPLPFNFC